MSRITSCLQQLARQNKKALIPYIVCGDPLPDVTLPLMQALVEAGANIIELGVPFSDPMAEGPVIQKAHERALKHHTSLHDVLDVVRKFRETNNATPVVLMGYANPVERMGYAAFADQASAAGVDGLLTVDMPPEEAAPLNKELKRAGIDNIFLLAPTTTADRAKQICDLATGYLYYVSLKGVTGAGHLDTAEVQEKLAGFRRLTSLPVCVGFGIKDAASAQQVSRVADGVVVGSVLVDKLASLQRSQAPSFCMTDALSNILRDMRRAMDNL
jgi:tryptophan synthase alpha chain